MNQYLLSTYAVNGEVPGAPKTPQEMQTFMERVMALRLPPSSARAMATWSRSAARSLSQRSKSAGSTSSTRTILTQPWPGLAKSWRQPTIQLKFAHFARPDA